MSPRYTVDLDTLLAFVERLAMFNANAEQIAAAVDQCSTALQTRWRGEGADAHRGYHEQWMTAVHQMREGLAELRGHAKVAHRNYTGVAQHNNAMWP